MQPIIGTDESEKSHANYVALIFSQRNRAENNGENNGEKSEENNGGRIDVDLAIQEAVEIGEEFIRQLGIEFPDPSWLLYQQEMGNKLRDKLKEINERGGTIL